jgi:hypothetical protein
VAMPPLSGALIEGVRTEDHVATGGGVA